MLHSPALWLTRTSSSFVLLLGSFLVLCVTSARPPREQHQRTFNRPTLRDLFTQVQDVSHHLNSLWICVSSKKSGAPWDSEHPWPHASDMNTTRLQTNDLDSESPWKQRVDIYMRRLQTYGRDIKTPWPRTMNMNKNKLEHVAGIADPQGHATLIRLLAR